MIKTHVKLTNNKETHGHNTRRRSNIRPERITCNKFTKNTNGGEYNAIQQITKANKGIGIEPIQKKNQTTNL